MHKPTDSNNQAIKWVGFGLFGLALGTCLALLGAAELLLLRVSWHSLASSLPQVVTALPPASATPVGPPSTVTESRQGETLAATSTPMSAESTSNEALKKAEAAMQMGDLALARSQLLSLLDQSTNPVTRARINGDLGDLEMSLGRYRLASGYYEQQYAYGKTPEVLIKLADSCNISGRLEEAERRYQELLDWSGSDADPYRDQAKEALVHVRDMLGTQVPTTMP